MSTQKLCQVIAHEKGLKARANETRDDIYNRRLQKKSRYDGLTKTWHKLEEDGAEFPPESKKAEARVEDDLKALRDVLVPWYDALATKERSNYEAKADVVVDGQTIAEGVPVTFLLFLEKDLVHMRTILKVAPTLDETRDWSQDEGTGFYKTAPDLSHRTKKVQKAIVLYDATEHHPAQTQLISEDVVIGNWKTINVSGAMTLRAKERLLARLEKLINAVRMAREEANTSLAVECNIGAPILDFIFAS